MIGCVRGWRLLVFLSSAAFNVFNRENLPYKHLQLIQKVRYQTPKGVMMLSINIVGRLYLWRMEQHFSVGYSKPITSSSVAPKRKQKIRVRWNELAGRGFPPLPELQDHFARYTQISLFDSIPYPFFGNYCARGRGVTPAGPTLSVLKQLRRKCCLCDDKGDWDGVLSFSRTVFGFFNDPQN